MAFIRWRGNCAQLLATIYSEKESKQITLANLPDLYVHEETKRYVEEIHPEIKVDWVKIARDLAIGSSTSSKQIIQQKQMDMAEVEEHLRTWATQIENTIDANRLYSAANILLNIRAKIYHNSTGEQSSFKKNHSTIL